MFYESVNDSSYISEKAMLSLFYFYKWEMVNLNNWKSYYLSNFLPPVLKHLGTEYIYLTGQNVNTMSRHQFTNLYW